MTRKELQSLVLLLVLAFGLRLSGIGFESLWLDECYQTLIEVYAKPRPDFVSVREEPFLFRFSEPGDTKAVLENFTRVDEVCPPLYGVLLNAWIRIFGGSDIAVRFLSCLSSLATVASVYFIGRSLFNPQAALLAGLLIAVSPFEIAYAQEARMYSLVQLCAALSFGSMIILCRSPKTLLPILPLAVYAVSTWAMINSHFTALFVALAGGLYGMLQVFTKKSLRLFFTLSVGWLLVGLLWLPWVNFFLQASAVRKRSFYVARAATWWWPFYALLFKVPVNWLSFLSGRRVMLPFVPLYASSAAMLGLSLYQSIKSEKRDALIGLWMWALVPALGIWFSDVMESHRIIEVSRYLIGTAPAIYLLCGFGLSCVTTRGAFWLYLFLAHVVLAQGNTTYHHALPQKEPWRQMATLVETNCGDDVLFVSQPYDIVCLDRYLNHPRRQIGLSSVMSNEQVAAAVVPYGRFWLLTALDGEAVNAKLPPDYAKKQEHKLPHGLILRLYER